MEQLTQILLGILILITSIIFIQNIMNKKSLNKSVEITLQQQNTINKDVVTSQHTQLIDRIDVRILDIIDRNTTFERNTTQNAITLNQGLMRSLTEHFNTQQTTIESRLDKIEIKVNESLNEGFKNTNKTFTDIVERLTKIDEAQKKIDALSVNIVSLQDVLTDKSSRGAFGEIQLNQILTSIFGEKNDKIYQTQYTFNTGTRADAVLFAPEPLGTVAIDSKFPLENYRRLIEATPNSLEYNSIRKDFVSDVKKHIDDIASKYIIHNVTSDQAIMFIPAEAIFAFINAYQQDIIAYSQRKRVWLTSPTTLMSTLTTLQMILMNMERDKYTHEIQEELRKLSVEFSRYRVRWDSLSKRLEQVNKEVEDINITSNKISNRFESIANVDYTEIE